MTIVSIAKDEVTYLRTDIKAAPGAQGRPELKLKKVSDLLALPVELSPSRRGAPASLRPSHSCRISRNALGGRLLLDVAA